jgi:hypothetical protein
VKINYIPQRGNLIDEYMSKFLSRYPSWITVKKLKWDWYLIQDRIKVLVRIKNNILVVRCGGGFNTLKRVMDEIAGYSDIIPEKPVLPDKEYGKRLRLPIEPLNNCKTLTFNQ